MTPRLIAILTAVAVSIVLFLGFISSLVVNLDASHVMVVQSVGGKLTWYETPGVKTIFFGHVTKYPRRETYAISGYRMQFNDGGHATVTGTIQYEIPTDPEHLNLIRQNLPDQEAVEQHAVEPAVDKALFVTGTLMSSRESFAEKKALIISYVEDQITNGIFLTHQRDIRVKDPITDEEKTQTIVEIATDANGKPIRAEAPPLAEYGIRPFNFSPKPLDYDPEVLAQIKQQQDITMSVQTSIANAKKAEQQAITIAKEGEATAAKAKWEQETKNATIIAEAEQKLKVAQLNAQTQEAYRQAETLRGEGDAAYRHATMQANGALEQKLDAYVRVNTIWADAFSKYQGTLVPQLVMGGGGAQGNGLTGAQQLMDLLGVKAARDLALDVGVAPIAQKQTRPTQAGTE